MKSAQTDDVGRELATVLREDAVIASLHGVRNAETSRRHAAKRPVLAGVVGFNVVQDGDTFRRTTSGELMLERVDAARAFHDAAADADRAARGTTRRSAGTLVDVGRPAARPSDGEIVRPRRGARHRCPLDRAIVDAVRAAEREQHGSPKHSADQLKTLLGLS